jgi:hypothetical protein
MVAPCLISDEILDLFCCGDIRSWLLFDEAALAKFFSWLQCFVSAMAFAVYPWNYPGKMVGPPNIKVSRSSTETGDFRRAGAGRRVVA